MNPTRKTKLEDLDLVQRTLVRSQTLGSSAKVHEKLFELQGFIRQLLRTAHGKAELDRRCRQFGDYAQKPDESEQDYYGRLRRWLDLDLKPEA